MQIFGVVNVSPDSLAEFTIGTTPTEAAKIASRHIDDGADFIDMGGQASHGDAALVTPAQEWAILETPLRAVLALGVDVSIDTWQVETARRALDAGATVLNAADALQTPGMIELAAERECTVVLPFMLGPDPRRLKHVEGDPVGVMVAWFAEQLNKATKFGIRDRLLLDPGTGFAPAHWDWSERREYQKAIYTDLDRLRVFDLPLYIPVPWKQTSDRLELLDIVLAHDPEYARAHIPAQVIERHRQVTGRLR